MLCTPVIIIIHCNLYSMCVFVHMIACRIVCVFLLPMLIRIIFIIKLERS